MRAKPPSFLRPTTAETSRCRLLPRRAPTPPEVLEQRERERELKELDRDTRTVFAYNLNLKADEKDLFDFFTRAGTVRPPSNFLQSQSSIASYRHRGLPRMPCCRTCPCLPLVVWQTMYCFSV